MSRSIDQRIVEMRFDNGQFESGAEKTLSTLDKLKQSLNVFGSGEALKDLGSNTLSGLTISLESATKGFSALEEIAVGALRKIGEQALMAGEHLVKEMSIDNVTAGWDKYAQKTTSVQTIMAATRKEIGEGKLWANEEEQMAGVNEQLDRLNWFTDETSYNFLDMVNNIGKFTNNGVKLEDAVTSMQGISTWAAISGANVQEASRAMYNLSQAMGVGHVQLIDWKSIENANMATMEFKEMAIQAALAKGTLKDLGDGLYESTIADSDPFGVEQFNTQLSKGKWLTKEVLTEVLGMYGEYTNILKDAQETLDYDTTSQLLQDVKQYMETGTFDDWDKVLKKTGKSADELREIFDKLGSEEYDLGRRSFIAAQEAKTFREAIDSVKDAAGTSWMNIFEAIFGNYIEAKELWTNLANTLYDAFIGPLDNLEDLLWGTEAEKGWRDFGGREALIESFSNTWEALGKIVGSVTEAFHDVFPPMTGERLADLTKKLQDFTEKLIISDETAEKLKSVFHVLFGVLKIGLEVISQIIDAIKPLISLLFGVGDSLLGFAGGFEESIDSALNALVTNQPVKKFITDVILVIQNFGKRLIETFQAIKNSKVGKILEDIWVSIHNFCFDVSKLLSNFHPFKESGIKEFVDKADPMGAALKIFGNALDWFVNVIKDASGTLGPLGKKLGGIIGTITNALKTAASNGSLEAIFTGLAGGAVGLSFYSMSKNVAEAVETITGPLEALKNRLGGGKKGGIKEVAIAIGILAASMFVLASINPDRIMSALGGMAGAFGELSYFSGKLVDSFKNVKGKAGIGLALIGMSVAILVLSSALKKFSALNPKQAITGLVSLGIVLKELQKFINNTEFSKGPKLGKALGLAVTVMAINNLAKAVGSLGALSIVEIGKGLIAIQLLSKVLREFGAMLDNQQSMGIGKAIGLVLVAASMRIISGAVQQLGSLDLPTIGKGLLSVGALLLEMAIFTKLAGGYKHMISIGIGVAAIATSLVILSKPMAEMGKLSLSQIGKGLLAIGGALLIITLAIRNLPTNTLVIGLGLTVVGAALHIIAGALSKLANFEPEQLAISLVMLATSLTMIVLALNGMRGTLGGAAAFAVIALGFRMLVPALERVGKMKIWSIIKALLALAGVLAIVAIAGLALAPAAIPLGIIAVSLAVLGAAAMAAGLAVALLSGSFADLLGSASDAAGWAVFKTILFDIVKMIPAVIATFIKGLGEVLKAVVEVAPILGNAIIEVGHAILSAIIELLPQLIEAATMLGSALIGVITVFIPQLVNAVLFAIQCLLEAILNHVPTIIGLVLQILIAICDTIAQNVGPVVASVVNLILSVIKGITDQIPVIIQAGFNLLLGLIYGMVEAVQTNTPLIVDAVGDLIDTVIDAIEYALLSFIDGLPVIGSIPGVSKWIEDSKASIEEGWNSDNHGVQVGASEAHGISEGLAQNGWEPIESARKLGSDVAGALTENSQDFSNVGSGWAQQLGGGLVNSDWSSFSPGLKNIGGTLAGDLTSGVTEGFDLTSLEFNNLGLDVVTNLSQGIGDNSGLLTDATAGLGTAGLESFSSLLPDFQKAGSDSALAISDQFTQLSPDFALSMETFGNTGLEGFTNLMPDFELAGQDSVKAISGGIDLAAPNAVSSANSVGTDSLTQVQNKESGFYESGKNFSIGLANGMNDYASEAANAAASVAAQAKAAADAQLGIASPSREMMKTGRFFDEGFAIGISQNETLVGGATSSMANSAIEAMRLALMSINDTVDDDLNLNPVIRPVVDLSDVQNSSSLLGGMLGNMTYSGVGQINPNANSNRMLDLLSAMNGMMGSGGTTNIEINVTGGPNANAKDIADAVMDRMNNELRRRKVAFG